MHVETIFSASAKAFTLKKMIFSEKNKSINKNVFLYQCLNFIMGSLFQASNIKNLKLISYSRTQV